MTIFRFIFSIFLAISIVFGIFWVLQSMINIASKPKASSESLQMVDFVRLKKETQLEKKERTKPKKPKPKKQPPKPKMKINKDVKVVKQPMKMENFNLDIPLNLNAKSALGDAMVSAGSGVISTNVVPVAKVDPIYPRKAKRLKKEGYVKLEFTITTTGTVKDIKVVEAKPEGLFESSAKRALSKWKFRPKKDEGKTVEQRAMLQIDFKLSQ